jgi:hypothetical protein
MRVFELQQFAQPDLLVVRHAENFRHGLFARKAFFLGIKTHIAAQGLDHVFAVGPVHDRERRRQIDVAAVHAQHQIGERMKSAAGDLAQRLSISRLARAAFFAARRVKVISRIGAGRCLIDQMGDLIDQRAGFPVPAPATIKSGVYRGRGVVLCLVQLLAVVEP